LDGLQDGEEVQPGAELASREGIRKRIGTRAESTEDSDDYTAHPDFKRTDGMGLNDAE